ncbi:lytic transglycosylase domain-containing protein [Vibrio sp. SCSIO 43140]|uniref:lytic transglycosylase domain-containing protein n=1 Tax=Vibrio sp. SCSIO 43140 TaxID=2819100 RepID=UPI00207576DF|nr:lytic transglycosylase domain-containing protein [Vibrio sp. SCSIO 43140]USD59096.1 lytic transglycosylase domain-containing protein [Vibrio sp. SCSIO 43140]
MFLEPDINIEKLNEVALSHQHRCEIVHEVSQDKKVPRIFLNLLVVGEGGKMGTKKQNTNKSWDLGPAQINTIHAEYIEKNYPEKNWVDVATDPELNISISADIFKDCLRYAKGNIWEAVGCYNSKTINIKTNYLYHIMKTWDYIKDKPKHSCTAFWD